MATLTKTFAFATTTEGFAGTSGPSSTLSYDAAVGNPAGSLKSRIAGRSKTDANYWEWTGTWEALGVPAGSTVTAIQLSSASTRCSEYATGAASTIGPYELRDAAGALLATLWAGRTVSAASGSWTATASQVAQSVPVEAQDSTTTVKIRLADTLKTGNSNSAAVTTYDDQVVLVVTYSAVVPARTATLGLGLGMSATAREVEQATAVLGLGLGLTATAEAVTVVSEATGTITLGFGLTASAVAVESRTATLSVAYGLAATSSEVGLATARVGLGFNLTGTASAVESRTARLGLGFGLVGAAGSTPVEIATASLAFALGLSATASAVESRTAVLGVGFQVDGLGGAEAVIEPAAVALAVVRPAPRRGPTITGRSRG